jgi:hypothetical protein
MGWHIPSRLADKTLSFSRLNIGLNLPAHTFVKV